jgi:hypothetical protein
MKKILTILFCLFCTVLFLGCPTGPEDPIPPVKQQEEQEEKAEEKKEENKETENPPSTNANILFTNNSSYPVSVYFNINPYTSTTPFVEISAKDSATMSTTINSNDASTFYFVYNLNFGEQNVYFPYFPEDSAQNHKSLSLTVGDNNVVIDEITACKTKSAFLFLENNSTSDIYLSQGLRTIKPYKSEDKFVNKNATAVYEVDNGNEGAFLASTASSVKIIAEGEEYSLPSIPYESGKIYTVTVINSTGTNGAKGISASLKAISPFNVDTARKMWGFSESSFLYNWDDRITPVIKPAYDKEKGSIMMGTLKNQRNTIGLLPVDQYGKYPETMDVLEAWTQNIPKDKVDTLIVSDFVEQSDGSFVMLLSCWDEDYYTNNMLIAFDFSKNLPLWDYDLPEDILFRHDSANKLIRLEDNKVVIAGGIIVEPENPEDYGEDDPYPMSPYLGIFDYTKKSDDGLTYVRNEEGCKTYTMDTPFDNESLFCSVFYDGTNIFASGFTDFDAKYDSVEHDGIIYKFNTDLSEPTEIYKKHNCLFFTLSGNGNKWYVCGEYWLKASDRLLGCYVSSSMIAGDANVNPVYYFGTNICTWFNQLCTYDNMIVMCGQTSTDKEGQVNPLPFVVAYDAQGNMLWENLSYKKWATALNVIPNTIGTYILQLTDKNNRQIHFVSADFLGNEVID